MIKIKIKPSKGNTNDKDNLYRCAIVWCLHQLLLERFIPMSYFNTKVRLVRYYLPPPFSFLVVMLLGITSLLACWHTTSFVFVF